MNNEKAVKKTSRQAFFGLILQGYSFKLTISGEETLTI